MREDNELNVLAGRVATLERRLAMVEARGRAPRALRRLLDTFLPPEARGHVREAQREQLRAIRSVLDRWIEAPQRDDDRRGRERIRIE